MGNEVDRHERVTLTNRYLERDGGPWIPVSGEFHYSRVPRDRWAERLRLMRASGITVVASYVFWIHHEEARGRVRFDGNLDVSAFVREAAAAGLAVVIRIGPWCHGEARNGGLPDWVLDACAETRRDDPGYLVLVREWFAALGGELAPLCGPSGPVIGIQLENELYDQPQHILTLKRLARQSGMHAPVWTATGWGAAQLPPREVLPLFGGYSDGFWIDWDSGWDESFREHFSFSHVWDDPGIGADQRTDRPAPGGPDPSFPPATCELGAGMGAAYHRRPVPAAADAAAIANVALGNGAAWQGFYMYVGGSNPAGADGMQESHRTGYPNDLPRFDYDFHAPIGAAGLPSPALAPLREHNFFVESFGPALAAMNSVLPRVTPRSVRDRETLRWAVRSDGVGGFVFVNLHQPREPLGDYEAARFTVETRDGTVSFPDRPVTIPSGTIARWPFALTIGDITLEWATASPLTVLPTPTPTLVLRAHRGIVPRACWPAGTIVTSTTGLDRREVEVGPVDLPIAEPLHLSSDAGALTVLVVDEDAAAELWGVEGRLVRSAAAVWSDGTGLVARSVQAPRCLEWDARTGAFVRLEARSPVAGRRADVRSTLLRPHATPPASYGSHAGRESAPTQTDIDRVAAVYRLSLPDGAGTGQDEGTDCVLTVDWRGDVAQLRVDGRPVADRFWDGSRWELDIRSVGIRAESEITLHIVPMRAGAQIGLNAESRALLDKTPAPWCAVDAIRYEESAVWRLTRERSTFRRPDSSTP